MISAVLATTIALVPATSAAPMDVVEVAATQLPAGWFADSGTPVAWNDTYVWLYDDAFNRMGADMYPAADAEIHRNAVVIDGRWITDPLPQSPNGGYWWQDGVELADGSLLVVVTEFENRWDLEPPMQFLPIDTDAFIVRQPSDPESWRWAMKIEDGPWGDDSVSFIDGTNLVVARDQWAALTGDRTRVFEYTDPTAAWMQLPSALPDSGAVFVPVQTATGWWGLSWGMSDDGQMDWHTVTMWHTPADKLGTTESWELVRLERTQLETHYHTLVLVDGVVLHRSNNLNGDRRPNYTEVNPPEL